MVNLVWEIDRIEIFPPLLSSVPSLIASLLHYIDHLHCKVRLCVMLLLNRGQGTSLYQWGDDIGNSAVMAKGRWKRLAGHAAISGTSSYFSR